MKNMPRIHKKGATKAVKLQAQNPSEFAVPKGDVQPSCLCVYNRSAKAPVSRIPLSDKEFSDLTLLAASPQGGLETFIADAIREKLNESPQPRGELLDEVEMAIRKACALLRLLADPGNPRTWEGNPPDDEREALDSGLDYLASQVITDLCIALETLSDRFNPNHKDAAA